MATLGNSARRATRNLPLYNIYGQENVGFAPARRKLHGDHKWRGGDEGCGCRAVSGIGRPDPAINPGLKRVARLPGDADDPAVVRRLESHRVALGEVRGSDHVFDSLAVLPPEGVGRRPGCGNLGGWRGA